MSNNKIRCAKFSIHEWVKQMKGHSFASRADMRYMLTRCIKDLHELGYKIAHIGGLKPKHIYVLVEHWKHQGKNPATIKNYMSKLRKMACLLGKPTLLKPGNDHYQIPRRSYLPTYNKAIHRVDFNLCSNPLIRLSLEAQSLFGLRREESMKIVLSEACLGDTLKLKPSWTKGGIGRTIELTNDAQRQWLMKAMQQVPKGHSLIPQEKTYKQHLNLYKRETIKMGLQKCHGLRHAYAQRRYQELTKQFDRHQKGLLCPIDGGRPTKSLNDYEKIIDRKAREIISRELGHSRVVITRIYLG